MDIEKILNSPAAKQWKRIGIRHHHGVAVPLFALRSKSSSGIGTYADLKLLTDWCVDVGMDIIQLLPLNDTGPDTSPYGAISAFALSPLYLDIESLENYRKDPQLLSIAVELNQLNKHQRVDYKNVRTLKEQFLRRYLSLFGKQIISSPSFHFFCADNQWLERFALFKSLKEEHHWHSWTLWSHNLRHPTPDYFAELLHTYAEEINYHIAVQYLCFKQMVEAKKYANSRGIFLKGDIPILISKESADVWFHRELFRIEMSAGAPPDMYSVNGQNWGFPIYRWNVMHEQGDLWWRQRLAVATNYYDIYRIDHVVGFYRIWAIPPNMTGREGEFIPADAQEELILGERNMQMMLDATPMLPIGEDLGVVPNQVRENLRSLGICGTKVMRWERMWNEDRRFIPIHDYIPESMTTVSTHDSETLDIWWSTYFDEVRDYCAFKGWKFTYELQREARYEILKDSHHTTSLFHINLLQEYLALIPSLTWHDICDERINIPGIINDTNWTYRMKPTLEDLLQNKELKQQMIGILA